MLTRERAAALLEYDPTTGVFTRLVARGGHPVGSVAGATDGSGHRQISVDGIVYLAHRLAWFMMTGAWPAGQVDHVNCVPDDNRWENLRQATHTQNCANSSLQKNNTSGIKGVYWDHGHKKWAAQLGKKRLGRFDNKDAAAAAYAAAASRKYGEFARIG